MSDYTNFTSLPAEQERTFVVYERFTVETGKKAAMAGLIAGIAFFVLTLGIVFSHSAPKESKIKKEDIQTSTSGSAIADDTDTSDTSATNKKKDDEDDEGDDDDDDDDDAKKDDAKKDDAKKDDAKKDGDDKKADKKDDAKKDGDKKDKKDGDKK